MATTNPMPTTNHDKSVEPEFEYAYYFPEGSGYLFVESLGHGLDGYVDIVWSCAEAALAYDGKDTKSDDSKDQVNLGNVHFVRKKTLPHLQDRQEEKRQWPNPAEEVRHYRMHKRIPELRDWVEYHPLHREHKDYFQFTSSSMIFQYCNGGTLGNVVEAYQNLNTIRQRTSMPGEQPPANLYIPESFIFIIFGQLLQVVDWLHHQQPGIDHADIHLRNIFLHFSKAGQLMPDCFLGDFGRSTTFDLQHWDTDGRPAGRLVNPWLYNYHDIRTIVMELMTLKEAVEVEGGSGGVRQWYYEMAKHLVGYTDLLYDQIRRFENWIDDAQEEGSNPDFSLFAQRLIAYGEALNALRQQSLRNTAQRHPGDPVSFRSCTELLQQPKDKHPSGPWKVAKIRTDNKAVVALSREVYETYLPLNVTAVDDYQDDLRGNNTHSILGSSRDVSAARL